MVYHYRKLGDNGKRTKDDCIRHLQRIDIYFAKYEILHEGSIYNLHIEFKGDDRQEKILVDFESHLNFNVNPKAIVIPDSLPKSKDIRKTYK